MDWDDLRYVLAVHKAGSVAGAGRGLNVSHVTVFRRIEKIEKNLGVRLFDRKHQGYVATPVGMEIVAQAEQVEEQINADEALPAYRGLHVSTPSTGTMPALELILVRPCAAGYGQK